MMGGETAWNMYSIDSNKEYCITLHLVGYTEKNKLTMHGHMNGKFITKSQGRKEHSTRNERKEV